MPFAGPELEFDEPSHLYRLHRRQISSVTQIIDVEGLISPFAKDPFYCARGRAVHAAAGIMARRRTPIVSAMIAPFVECFGNFMDDMRPEFERIEAPVYSEEYWYAGTLDFDGHWQNGQRFIIDLKHSTSLRKPDENTQMQTSAYRLAAYPKASDLDVKIYGLMVNPVLDRGYCLIEYDFNEGIQDFLAAKRMAAIKLRKRLASLGSHEAKK